MEEDDDAYVLCVCVRGVCTVASRTTTNYSLAVLRLDTVILRTSSGARTRGTLNIERSVPSFF